MGVLKVWDGTDWRKVGCGDGAVTVTDTFTAADSTPLSGRTLETGGLTWSAAGAAIITSNRAAMGNVASAIWVDLGSNPTVAANVDLSGGVPSSSTTILHVYICSTGAGAGSNDSYLFQRNPFGSAWDIYRNGNSFTPTTGSTHGTFSSASHDVEMSMLNGLLTVRIDGSTVLTYDDPSPLTGRYCGLASPNGGGSFDNFAATGTVPAGRLRLRLPDGSWVREVCDDDHGPVFTDDFNRTDSTSSVSNSAWVPWTSDTASAPLYVWGIRSGSAYANGPFSGADNILYYDVGTTDYDFTATYTGASGKDPWVGLVFSFDTASGGSHRVWTNNGIGGRDSGGGTGMIQTGFPSIVAGDVLRIVCSGLAIELFLNGVSVSTITNTWADTGGATRVGLYGNTGDQGGQWDDVAIIAGVEKHPLKIEDPANPGTWITVACFTPV